MATRILIRRDTTANWLLTDPVFANGEPAIEQTQDGYEYIIIGDGVNRFSQLPRISYPPDPSLLVATVTQVITDLGGVGGSGAGFAPPAVWATGQLYPVGKLVYTVAEQTWFQVLVEHTSTGSAPTITTPGVNYSVFASPSSVAGSLLRRNSAGEATVDKMFIIDNPGSPQEAAHKAYVDVQIANLTPPERPAQPWPIIYSSPNWTYKGAVVTARPAGMVTGDILMFVGNPGGSVPTWAATNDVWIQG